MPTENSMAHPKPPLYITRTHGAWCVPCYLSLGQRAATERGRQIERMMTEPLSRNAARSLSPYTGCAKCGRRFARKPRVPVDAPYMVAVDSSRGAPMGRPTKGGLVFRPVQPIAEGSDAPGRAAGYDQPSFADDQPMHLRRVPMVDGDYDPGGAYWGGRPSPPLYCAWNNNRVYWTRAFTRKQAAAALELEYTSLPGWLVAP